jgi:hypothetical protein
VHTDEQFKTRKLPKLTRKVNFYNDAEMEEFFKKDPIAHVEGVDHLKDNIQSCF